jgi:atypical dual specificity phosphatase
MSMWWIDEPFLLGSSNPTDTDLERLRHEGFKVVVSLLDENEQAPRYDPGRAQAAGYVRHNISIRDFHAPSVSQLQKFIEFVQAVDSDAKVLVHCEGGSGRTGTMAAAYWIAKGLSPSQAIEKVRRARPGAVETDEQRGVLERFRRTWAAGRSGEAADSA